MKEKIFELLKAAVSEKANGEELLRADIIKRLLQYYKPGPKDSKNAGIRSGVNPILKMLINKDFLIRIGRGKYCILKKDELIKLNYKEFIKAFNENRERKAY